MMEEKFNIKTVKVHRTKEGTVFEAVTVMVLIVSWVMALFFHCLSSNDDVFSMAVLTVVSLLFLWRCYYKPGSINITGVSLKNTRQVALAIRFARIVALWLALLMLTLTVMGANHPMMKSTAIGFVIVIGLIGFFFIYIIQKAE